MKQAIILGILIAILLLLYSIYTNNKREQFQADTTTTAAAADKDATTTTAATKDATTTTIQHAAQQTTLSPAPVKGCLSPLPSKLKKSELRIKITDTDLDNCKLDKKSLTVATKKIFKAFLEENTTTTSTNSKENKIEDLWKIKFYSGSVQIVIDFINENIKLTLDKIMKEKKLDTNPLGPIILKLYKELLEDKSKLAQAKKDKMDLFIEMKSKEINKKFINNPGYNLYQDIIADNEEENSNNKIWIPDAPLEYNDGFEPNLLLNTYNCNQDFMQSLCSKPKTKAAKTKAAKTKAVTTKAATTKAATTKAATTKAATTKAATTKAATTKAATAKVGRAVTITQTGKDFIWQMASTTADVVGTGNNWPEITLQEDDVVTWTGQPGPTHWFGIKDKASGENLIGTANSKAEEGKSFSKTWTVPSGVGKAKYSYYCPAHAMMNGDITIISATTTTAAATTTTAAATTTTAAATTAP